MFCFFWSLYIRNWEGAFKGFSSEILNFSFDWHLGTQNVLEFISKLAEIFAFVDGCLNFQDVQAHSALNYVDYSGTLYCVVYFHATEVLASYSIVRQHFLPF